MIQVNRIRKSQNIIQEKLVSKLLIYAIRSIQTKKIKISSGDVLGFSSTGIVGTIIRAASGANDIKNSLGITHSGIAIFADPWDIYHMVLRLTSQGKATEHYPLSYKAGEAIRR